jgi:hypothetical protein
MVTANKDFTQVEPDRLEDEISKMAQQVWQPKRFNTKQLTEGQYNTDKKLVCCKFRTQTMKG